MPPLAGHRAKEGYFMNQRTWNFGGLASMAFLIVAAVLAMSSPAADVLPKLTGMEFIDLSGQKHVIGRDADARLTIIVFLGTQCPISNGYAPALRRLHDANAAAGVRIFGVHCDRDVSAEIAKTHAREYDLPFPLVLDHEQRLAQACGVKIVPTAVVVAADGPILYRGRIDNRHVANGVRRPEATTFDLKMAIDSALAGQPPDPSTTEPVGCPMPPLRR